jgi:ATP-dependent Lon protease
VNGLAYSAVGGCITQIEVAVMPGTGKIELTGSLGDVMKESAKTAISFIRSIGEKYGIDNKVWTEKDIHIHAPEGAVPKDGPSAGITMATAVLSALGNFKVDRFVTMTGEISLTGRVMRIGGLREKSMAAYKSGAKKVVIPKENMPDLWEIDEKVKAGLEFIPVSKAQEVFDIAFKCDKTFDISGKSTVNFTRRGSVKPPVQNGRGKRNEV